MKLSSAAAATSSGFAAMAAFMDGLSHDVVQNARNLQFQLPDYTSPPLPEAIAATPQPFQSDDAVEAARVLASLGQCDDQPVDACNIIFDPPTEAVESGTIQTGIVFYNGALVDPRGYSLVAKTLADRYGIPVVMPVFPADLPTVSGVNGTCGSGRVPKAIEAFPYVKKWVLAGHSFGGIAAQNDLWAMQDDESIAGLVLLGSYLRQDVCDAIDFFDTDYPMAVVQAELDGVLTVENAENATKWYPQNTTFHMEINGGNHGFFGSYNDTERTALLFQTDGEALIPNVVQRELVVGAILHVASRVGVPLPVFEMNTLDTITASTEAPTEAATEAATEDDDGATDDGEASTDESSGFASFSPSSFVAMVLFGFVAVFV